MSFAGAVQAVGTFAERLLGAEAEAAEELYGWLLLALGAERVGDRPDRVEPRARKRRPTHYPLLTQPRDEARKKLQQSR